MVVFCVRNVHLDAHSDIRGRHISVLLKTLIDKVVEYGCDHFSRDNLVALLCAAKRLLFEVSKGASVVEAESRFNFKFILWWFFSLLFVLYLCLTIGLAKEADSESTDAVETDDAFTATLQKRTIEGLDLF